MRGRRVRLLERVDHQLPSCERIVLQAESQGGLEPPVSAVVHGVGDAVVAVLPYDPVADIVVLVEQLRPGAWAVGDRDRHRKSAGWTLEVVAGRVDVGHTPAMAARKELKEEILATTTELLEIRRYLTDPVTCGTRVWQFCGLIDAATVPDRGGALEEGETLRVHRFPGDRLPELLSDPAAANAATLICLQWLVMHRDSLQARAHARFGSEGSGR